jgi:hypothetical protein
VSGKLRRLAEKTGATVIAVRNWGRAQVGDSAL